MVEYQFSSSVIIRWDLAPRPLTSGTLTQLMKNGKKLIGKNESHQAAASSCTLATRLKASRASNKYELIIKYKSEEIIVLPSWLPARLLLRGCWAAFLSDSGSTLCPEKQSGTPSSWLSAAEFAWTESFLFQHRPHTTPQGASPLLFSNPSSFF